MHESVIFLSVQGVTILVEKNRAWRFYLYCVETEDCYEGQQEAISSGCLLLHCIGIKTFLEYLKYCVEDLGR